MRIGIFGGSYNPPRKTHKKMAITLIESGYLDKVIFVPVGNLYKKPGLAKDVDRYNMIKLMIKGYEYLDVSDYEFSKFTSAYQTLDHFKEEYPNDELYFICGTDNLKEFETWKEYEYLLENYKVISIIRNHDDTELIKNKFNKYMKNINIVDLNSDFVSSTEIRNSLKENRSADLEDKVDKEVIEYIISNGLY